MDSLDKDILDMLVGCTQLVVWESQVKLQNLILWLSSTQSSFVNGAYFPIDGGYLAQ